METELLAILALSLVRGFMFLVGYLSQGNTFPHPLSEGEEAQCLERWEAGDEEGRNTLVVHNLRLVAHIVKKFDNTGEDPDDLISTGVMGLMKAINTFDRHKGTKLATYAARCIENDM